MRLQGGANTVESEFLGQNAKLVNLDALVDLGRAPAAGSGQEGNPFAMLPPDTTSKTASNPFLANVSPQPTLNQMRDTSKPGTYPYPPTSYPPPPSLTPLIAVRSRPTTGAAHSLWLCRTASVLFHGTGTAARSALAGLRARLHLPEPTSARPTALLPPFHVPLLRPSSSARTETSTGLLRTLRPLYRYQQLVRRILSSRPDRNRFLSA